MIIGLSGFINSGKGTVSTYLQQKYGFIHLSFADSLKESVSAIFCWPYEKLAGITPESRAWREKIDTWWAKRLNIPHLTPRWVLQHFGTDICRNLFHKDIWIASLEKKLQNLSKDEDVVIDDLRFSNEFPIIKNHEDGFLLRVNRGELPEWYNIAVSLDAETLMPLKFPDVHLSEWEWVKEKFDYEIDNNGSINQLYSIVDDFLLENR